MGNKKSLTYLVSKYAIFELIFTFFVIIFSYTMLNFLINEGGVYPANYADMESDRIEEEFLEDDFSTNDIPFYYNYRYIENGEVIENTINPKYDAQVQEVLKKRRVSIDGIIGSNVFKIFEKDNKKLIINYKIRAVVASPKIFKYIKDFELSFFGFVLIVWLLGFVLLVRHFSNLLRKEIKKISVSNLNIEKMNLNYNREKSKYIEISGVLDSIDKLANNLKISLEKQWNMQEEQKDIIESITHDVRTPITLIKGNIDLLKEDSESLEERLDDISNGVVRLEAFIDKLKDFSYLMEGTKVEITDQVIEEWLQLVGSICRLYGYELDILAKETSPIKLDKDAVAIALQNLINNSIENSPKSSSVSIGFFDESNEFIIIIRDKGLGFDEELIPRLKEKLISSKGYDGDNIHGLGLSIANKIVETNNGNLLIGNYQNNDIKGAEIKIVFKKIKIS